MESEILDGNYATSNNGLSDEAKSYLKESAKWAKFLSIIAFIGIGFIALVGLFFGTFMSAMTGLSGDEAAMAAIPTTFITIFYLGLAGVMIIPTLNHYRFAVKTQRALRKDDEPLLTEALGNLKSYYKFYGLLTAILVGIYALMFVLGGIGMMAMG